MYRLVWAHDADVHHRCEGRFAPSYGSWRAATDTAVGAGLDCGILDDGVPSVRCGACRAELRLRPG